MDGFLMDVGWIAQYISTDLLMILIHGLGMILRYKQV
jgi:hypothetical protein